METALIVVSLFFGAWAGWRMLGRAIGVLWARLVSSVLVQSAWAWVVALGTPPDDDAPSQRPDEAPSHVPSLAQDGASSALRDATPDPLLYLTSVEIVRGLANVKKIDSDGNAEWLSKDRIAAVAGMRAAEARAIIDDVRGTEKPAPPIPPQTPHAGRHYDPSKYREQAV